MATTADDVWRLLGELVEAQKENAFSLKETERILKEQSQETERLFQAVAQESQETERRFQETERRFQETERCFQETERFFQKTAQENRQVNKQLGELGGAWGRFVEDLVAPACERLFVARGIPVDQVSQRVKRRRQGDTLEIDVLVVNQGHVLAVEVKSSLSVEDVKEFVGNLAQFRTFFPEYAAMQIYGAVAGIGIESGADRYAYRQGLSVLAQSGDSVVMLNDEQFQPKAW